MLEVIYLTAYILWINIIIRPLKMKAKVVNTVTTSITGIQILASECRISIK